MSYHGAMVTDDVLTELEELVGHQFADRGVLARAMRHGSAVRAATDGSYERLEFLGDAVLGLAVGRMLFDWFPTSDQGALTRMRALLTRSSTLAAKARELGLERAIEAGRSEDTEDGTIRRALLEDVLEALVGAVFLDGGFEPAFQFVARLFADDLERLDETTLRLADPKTALQEAAQGRGLALPAYHSVSNHGPDHRPRWVVEVEWDGDVVATGEGSSKRSAQTKAARQALIRLGLVEPEETDSEADAGDEP